MLDSMCSVYTMDTSCFYTDEEHDLDKKLRKSRGILFRRKEKYGDADGYSDRQKRHIKTLNDIVAGIKNELKAKIDSNVREVRSVRPEALNDSNIVAIFESNLTRCLKMRGTELNDCMIIVKVFYFGVAESIVKNGFEMNGERYIFFSASAGQIRVKKFVAIKESLLKEAWNTLTCGLSVNDINEAGGVNVNKYLAYLALCNSATDVWEGFDIDRSIVIEDFETEVGGVVDFIDEKTYTITRQLMNVPITHSDGCGMILPSVHKKNFMVRAPWVKGLLSPFPFDKFILEANRKDAAVNHGIVTDIYGKKYDIIADNIQVIFTKSQFKMWKYYKSWDDYKVRFKLYECTAGLCNVEEDYIDDAKFNYQMMQTLVDLTDEELEQICGITNKKLKEISSEREVMLKSFGAVATNSHRNAFQECLLLYPELLQDAYSKETLREIKISIEKSGRAGRVDIEGKYLFLIPDLYAFCEHVFLRIPKPNGLLKNGDVYSRVYHDKAKLDCLRSPHLYMEHAVRQNVSGYGGEPKRWFITDGVYTSSHDLISKILQFDVDGDKSLVCADRTIIAAAERNGKDVVPLFYNMAKAPAQVIDSQAFYDGMIAAYTGGNIGIYSNNISKEWSKPHPNQEVIKLLCAENNFTIDYAKTLYKPTRPKHIDKLIRECCKGKLPHFFIYAKDKEADQVKRTNKSCVNRLEKTIKSYKFNFNKKQLGTFDYCMLMDNPEQEIGLPEEEIIKCYQRLVSHITNRNIGINSDNNKYIEDIMRIRHTMSAFGDASYIVDVLVKQLFNVRKSKRKAAFWDCYGDIVTTNLHNNLDSGLIMCAGCGKRIKPKTNQKFCEDCRGYKLVGSKEIKCIDCGITVIVNSKGNKTTRCEECQHQENKNVKREYYHKKKRALSD